jgi:hypothetical protein
MSDNPVDPRIRISTEEAAQRMLIFMTKQHDGGMTSYEYTRYMSLYIGHMEEILEVYLASKGLKPR